MVRPCLSLRVLMIFAAFAVQAQDTQLTIKLPLPDTTGGRPLMQLLKERKSTRDFSEKSLSDTTLANLLWAAFGVNRADGRRTAPSARNRQEITLYLCMKHGVFVYHAQDHTITQVLGEDVRKTTGTQDFVTVAPLNLVYVADMSKVNTASAEDAAFYVGADCGFIAENVYLFCTSQGLATVVRGLVDRTALSQAINLTPNQRILLAQTVGYAKK